MADPAGTKTVEEAKKGRTVPDPARETDLVVPDTRRNPEEAKKNKPRVVSYPQRMSWKVRRRSTIRRWFARRLWKQYENQHVLLFSVHW